MKKYMFNFGDGVWIANGKAISEPLINIDWATYSEAREEKANIPFITYSVTGPESNIKTSSFYLGGVLKEFAEKFRGLPYDEDLKFRLSSRKADPNSEAPDFMFEYEATYGQIGYYVPVIIPYSKV